MIKNQCLDNTGSQCYIWAHNHFSQRVIRLGFRGEKETLGALYGECSLL